VLPEGYLPGWIQHLQQYFLVELQPIDPSGPRRVRLIDPDRQGLIREFGLDGPLLGAALLPDNKILLLVEVLGQGQLFRYTPSVNRFEAETGPDTRNFRSLLPLPSGEMVLRSTQLVRYTPGLAVRTGQFSTLSNGTFQFVSHDPLLNRLLAVQAQEVSYINLTTAAAQTILLPEAVRFGFLTRSRK